MARSRFLLTVPVLLAALGLVALAAASPAAAGDEYQRTLSQPCVACHTTGVSDDLNARGLAFAAVADHRADPKPAWAAAVQAVPIQPASSGGVPAVIVPVAVFVLLVAWVYTMLRRRRLRT